MLLMEKGLTLTPIQPIRPTLRDMARNQDQGTGTELRGYIDSDLLINLAFSKVNQVSAVELRKSHKRLKPSSVNRHTHPPHVNVPTNSLPCPSSSPSTSLCNTRYRLQYWYLVTTLPLPLGYSPKDHSSSLPEDQSSASSSSSNP